MPIRVGHRVPRIRVTTRADGSIRVTFRRVPTTRAEQVTLDAILATASLALDVELVGLLDTPADVSLTPEAAVSISTQVNASGDVEAILVLTGPAAVAGALDATAGLAATADVRLHSLDSSSQVTGPATAALVLLEAAGTVTAAASSAGEVAAAAAEIPSAAEVAVPAVDAAAGMAGDAQPTVSSVDVSGSLQAFSTGSGEADAGAGMASPGTLASDATGTSTLEAPAGLAMALEGTTEIAAAGILATKEVDADASLPATGSQAGSAEASLAAFNLVANGDFTNYPTSPGAPSSWAIQGVGGSSGSVNRETVDVRSSPNAVRIVATNTRSSAGIRIEQSLPSLIPGSVHRVRAWVRRGVTNTAPARLVIINVTDNTVVLNLATTSNTWVRLSALFVPVAGKTYRIQLCLGTANVDTVTAGDEAYFDDAECDPSLRSTVSLAGGVDAAMPTQALHADLAFPVMEGAGSVPSAALLELASVDADAALDSRAAAVGLGDAEVPLLVGVAMVGGADADVALDAGATLVGASGADGALDAAAAGVGDLDATIEGPIGAAAGTLSEAEGTSGLEAPAGGAFPVLDADGEVQAQGSIVGEAAADTACPAAAAAPSVTDVASESTMTAGGSLAATTIESGDMPCSKDCFVRTDQTLGVCNDALNHDGEDLRVDNLTTQDRDSYIGFDLSGISPAYTITAAELVLNVVTVPVTGCNIEARPLADVDEGWSEASISCPTAPAPSGSLQTLAIPNNTAGDRRFALNANWISRLQARLGVGVASIVLRQASLETMATFQDNESGPTQGPRLKLTLTAS